MMVRVNNMRHDSISMLHVIFLAMTVIGLKNHVTILPPLLEHAGRDGWISVLLASVSILPWAFILLYIHKQTNKKNIKDVLEERIGKIATKIFNVTFSAFLIVLAAFTMKEAIQWINATFLLETPAILLLVIYTLLCVFLATSDLQTIVITNFFVLFGVVAFGFFVAFTNIKVKDYNLLRPFLEHGFEPVIDGMIYPAAGIIELALVILIQHQIKGRIRFFHYAIIIGILTVLTLGPLTGAITEFGPREAAMQRFPAYEEWGLVAIGRFIEHLDFLSIYQWLTGAFIRVGVLLYVVVNLLNLKGKRKKIWGGLAPIFLGVCFYLLQIDDQLFITLHSEYLLPITFVLFFGLTLFFFIIAMLNRRAQK